MALNLTDLEVKVEEATSNEPWGPHGSVMAGMNGSRRDRQRHPLSLAPPPSLTTIITTTGNQSSKLTMHDLLGMV